jgi:Domain of unknown function (DUF4249)
MRKILFLLNLILLLANCVREVDYQQPEANKNTLVVSGRLTNLDEPQILTLTRPGDYNKQTFEPVRGAIVTLRDDLGNDWTYQESSLYYQVNKIGEPGRTYTLDILLPDGSRYQSSPQYMPPPVDMETLTLKGAMFEYQRAEGGTFLEPTCLVNAKLTAPGQGFVRWDAGRVYIFNERIKPEQKQCFVTDNFNSQNIKLVDLSELQAGTPVDITIAQRKINFSFEERQCFSVYQLTINEEAYKYWSKINLLLGQNGTIFDTPPAVVTGNIFAVNSPDAPAALGFFEVGSADFERKYLMNGDLGEEYRITIDHCQIDLDGWPPVPDHAECDNCLVLPNSSLQKPSYWQ